LDGQTITRLRSFHHPLRAAVIGASGGIGRALAEALAGCDEVATVVACSRSPSGPEHAKVVRQPIDLEDEASIAEAAQAAPAYGELDLVIVATGVLHGRGLTPEKTWRAIEGAALARSFWINAIGPALVAKHFLPLLGGNRKTAFAALSARVGSITDNQLGGWYAYRASKAALNQLIRTLAIELARRNPEALCVGLHPGTVDTALSAPFQSGVPEGKLFTPAIAAARLLAVLDNLGPEDSGHLFAWDGEAIPF
jgi:NAD(P)-dependent dehydrogenase (short-subunit alcohol dehydrogenase family)